jgi:predicted nuclease of predicted toxin-antitoxin system
MSVKFLLDENIEHEVLHRLEKFGYTTQHIEFHPELGKGTDDAPIATFSLEHNWVIVTYDPDFVIGHDASDYFGVVYFEDDSLSAKQTADILHSMATQYPPSAFEGVEFGSSQWI